MKRRLTLLLLLLLIGCASEPKLVDTPIIETSGDETPTVETPPKETKTTEPIVVVLPTPTTETEPVETETDEPANVEKAYLGSLVVSNAKLSPAFSKDVASYQVNFSKHQKNVQVTAVAADYNGKVKINTAKQLTDKNVKTTYTITVSAPDKENKTYKVVVVDPREVSTPKPPSNSGIIHLPTPKEATIVDGILLVNKKHGLPSTYNPGENKTAGTQIRKLISDMQAEGLNVRSKYSGFRSFSSQKSIFERYVKKDGVAKAETYSARPGFSEHQTGLTFDLFTKNDTFLGINGRDLKEVNWLKENAAKYGFIIRYPLGKEGITGYKYEPWHLRYIGPRAQEIADSGLTLEEFLNRSGGDYQR